MKYETIIMDLDHTLVEFDDDHLTMLHKEWFKNMNCPLDPALVHYKTLKEGLKKLGVDVKEYKSKWLPKFKEIEMIWRELALEHGEITLIPGVREALQNMPGKKILVSNAPGESSELTLKYFDLLNEFDFVYLRSYDINDVRKPDKRILEVISNNIKIDKPGVVVGDEPRDRQFATNIGFDYAEPSFILNFLP